MSKYEELTTCLLSAGGAPSGDGKWILTYEEDKCLYYKVLATLSHQVAEDSDQIASDVKPGTCAPYLQMGDKRLVIYVSDSNILMHAVCGLEEEEKEGPTSEKHEEEDDEEDEEDDSQGEWKVAPLAPTGQDAIQLHLKSRLTMCLVPAGIMVFFQATDNTIKGLVTGPGGWEYVPDVPVQSMEGSALAAVEAKEKLHLFYIHKDKSTHYAVQDPAKGTWEDHTLPDSTFETPITHMLVSYEEGTDSFVVAYLTDNTVYLVKSSEKKKRLGTIEGKKFKPADSAEAILVGYIPVYVDYRGQRRGKMVSVNNDYWSIVQPRFNPRRRR